jgi:hypothetical protein
LGGKMDIDKKVEKTQNDENESKTNKDIKVLLIIIAALLVILVIIQVVPAKVKSAACSEALKEAEVFITLPLDFMDTYEDDVYGPGVENINQQIFRVGEYQYMALEKIALDEKVLLKIITECQ